VVPVELVTVGLPCSARTASRSAGPSHAQRPTIVATSVGNSITGIPSGASGFHPGGTRRKDPAAVPVARGVRVTDLPGW